MMYLYSKARKIPLERKEKGARIHQVSFPLTTRRDWSQRLDTTRTHLIAQRFEPNHPEKRSMSLSSNFELVERDGAGTVTSTYIESASSESKSRVDIVVRLLTYEIGRRRQ